jgi:hypothetical protein
LVIIAGVVIVLNEILGIAGAWLESKKILIIVIEKISKFFYHKAIVGNFENFVKNFGQNISKFRNKNIEISKTNFEIKNFKICKKNFKIS